VTRVAGNGHEQPAQLLLVPRGVEGSPFDRPQSFWLNLQSLCELRLAEQQAGKIMPEG